MPAETASHEHLLVDEESSSAYGVPEKDFDEHKPRVFNHRLLTKLSWLAQGILFAISVSVFYFSGKKAPTDMQCVKHMSTYCEQSHFGTAFEKTY
jgi:hypothetical protein